MAHYNKMHIVIFEYQGARHTHRIMGSSSIQIRLLFYQAMRRANIHDPKIISIEKDV